MTATEPAPEQATYTCPLALPEMGGDGWYLEVPEGQPVTLHWGNGDYGIHVTRSDGEKRFDVQVNVLFPAEHMNEALQKLAQVISEQIGSAYGGVSLRMDVSHY
jgi:hypothetical protein